MSITKQCQSDGCNEFRKKTFTATSFVVGLGRFLRNLPRLVRAQKADRVDTQFAEKIMLAVTAINECQYCSRYHTDLALEAGMDEDTIEQLLERDVDGAVAPAERPALLFAQRYAETSENPGRNAVVELRDTYGPDTAADIQAFVRAIYFGNLLGNTYDGIRSELRCRASQAKQCLQTVITAFC
ncbi:carboxymuconolactone decarboxylase family protein [Natronorubrum thiooxidans]|uniref:Alkylhydroperoxidase AhpD family core domain-containing protein n=1 Tax=Natronorubrum thiooxidans TaxID=308853 RepID=A0A1N7H0Q0_9EURY|nr:carboxymuconolactone decarboxylase family protein [Natronorubrum thiooxidans]SIS18405.1 alkylhydroperoxidase AhpD family core domain-containing protein [Natronorubrum thiooxidans]